MQLHNFKIIMLLILLLATSACTRNCNCEDAFAWVKQTFEENDAGFQSVIDRKGRQTYEAHTQTIARRIRAATNNQECAEAINEWLHFFRTGHIGVRALRDDRPASNTQASAQRFPDWERVDVDLNEFRRYLREKQFAGLEGIWQHYVGSLGIKKIDEQYIGFVIESQAEGWENGQVVFRVYPDRVIYYMCDRSVRIFRNADLISKNFLMFDYDFRNGFLTRNYPRYNDRFRHSVSRISRNRQPYLERLNETTLYLRIPSFEQEYYWYFERLISRNKDKITQTENLIIDVRFNGGGNDTFWYNLMYFIATNPVRLRNHYILSSEINNQYWTESITEEFAQKLNKNLGQLVLRCMYIPKDYKEIIREHFPQLTISGSEDGRHFILNFNNGVLKFPKRVGIIADRYTGSSAESFLFAARQSQKVKIFGHPTFGALDFSNINEIVSPCGNFELTYATTKSVDIDKFPIDGIGIQPDFFLGGIPGYRWVDFVNDILNHR